MDVQVGSRIAVEAERVGQPERAGQVIEVAHEGDTTRLRVRWDDGHTSSLHPSAGSVRVLSPR